MMMTMIMLLLLFVISSLGSKTLKMRKEKIHNDLFELFRQKKIAIEEGNAPMTKF